MAISRIKVWIDGEQPSASELNGEFNNIINNATSLLSPLTGGLDFDGNTITLDTTGVSTLVSSAGQALAITTGTKTGTSSNSTGSMLSLSSHIFNDAVTAASGTATHYTAVSIGRPTITATNASVTTTNAATLYILNAPLASTNQTITNTWALWVDDGKVRFDGGCHIDVVATGSLPAAAAAQDGRILIEDAGTGDRNVIIYAGGQRFRIDGGTAF